jgi:hypothetical protein
MAVAGHKHAAAGLGCGAVLGLQVGVLSRGVNRCRGDEAMVFCAE